MTVIDIRRPDLGRAKLAASVLAQYDLVTCNIVEFAIWGTVRPEILDSFRYMHKYLKGAPQYECELVIRYMENILYNKPL